MNIDHIATIREARKAREPEPLAAALIAERAGAHGITVHLRTDRRHIQDHDLDALRHGIGTRLNVEMAVTDEMARIALRVRPAQVTLVPERPQELTTEGGLDVLQNAAAVQQFTRNMREAGIMVSVFLDADPRQVEAAKAAEADAIEINTGGYAEADGAHVQSELDRIIRAARMGTDAGLEVLAGHGLNYVNVRSIVAVPEIVELNIGHSIVARAALQGMEAAVRDMLALVRR